MLATRKIASTLLGAFLALTMFAAPVDAQETVTLDFAGGVGIPVGDLADFQDVGPSFDIGVDLRVHPRFSIRGSGGAELLNGATIAAAPDAGIRQNGVADMSLIHFDAGGVFHALDDGPWRVDVNLGGGITVWDSERQEFTCTASSNCGPGGIDIIDLAEITPNVTAGLDLGYMVSEQVEFFVGGDGHLFFLPDAEDNESVFALGRIADGLDAPERGWSFPVAGGVRFHFVP